MKEIQAISAKLDCSMRIGLSISKELGVVFSKTDAVIPLYATLNQKSTEISLFLDNEKGIGKEISYGRLTHTKKGSFEVYKLRAEELVFEFEFFRDIVQIPSVVPNGLYLKEGAVYADFRFHHSVLGEMNSVIRRLNLAKNRIRLLYLGKFDDFNQKVREMNSRIPLSKITFVYETDEEYLPPEDVDSEPIGETKPSAFGLDTGYDMVFYGRKMPPGGIAVDASAGIFESKFRTRYMRNLMSKIKQNEIPYAYLFGKYYRDRIECYFYMPSFMADDLLTIMYNAADQVNNTKVELITYSPLQNTID